MTTIAGSWIGGGANQAAMTEVFAVDNNLFGMMVAVDIVASAFHPSLAPVGVLLAVLGYALGTYGRVGLRAASAAGGDVSCAWPWLTDWRIAEAQPLLGDRQASVAAVAFQARAGSGPGRLPPASFRTARPVHSQPSGLRALSSSADERVLVARQLAVTVGVARAEALV